MKKIIENTLCFTHGGRLAGLYGILATNKLSSNGALAREGDNLFKFTDSENKFNQEDNFLFFESMEDRGRINYASFVDNKTNDVGFAFLVIANGQSLLNQVDTIGNSDGILMGRSDNQPLEIDMKELNYKILVPESYKEDIEKFCANLKQLGLNPPQELLIFKPINELQNLVGYRTKDNSLSRQKQLCDEIGIKSDISNRKFAWSEKIVETKTSKVIVYCDEPLESLSVAKLEKRSFNNADDLVKHMKERPTISNIQRNTLLLFSEYTIRPIESITRAYEAKGSPLIIDLVSKPEDLAFCLNSLATCHISKEKNSHGEERISSSSVRDITNRLNNSVENLQVINGLKECLEIIKDRNITAKECANILENHKIPDPIENNEDKWTIAINRVQYSGVANEKQVKELMQANLGKEVLLWKEGMPAWKNALEVPAFMSALPMLVSPPSLINDASKVMRNITSIRDNNMVGNPTTTLKIS